LCWRKENKIDTIRDEIFPKEYNTSMPYEEIGIDKLGRPGKIEISSEKCQNWISSYFSQEISFKS
jgi:hypothetical protein